MSIRLALLSISIVLSLEKCWPLKLLPLGDSITWGCGDTCERKNGTPYCDGGYGSNYTCCAKPFGSPVAEPWTPCFGCAEGYRGPLLRMLNNGNATWSTVGTLLQKGEGGSPAVAHRYWAAHDGHPGWRIDQLFNQTVDASGFSFFANWTKLRPDAILLMAGTNDIGQLHDLDCSRTVKPWSCSVDKILQRMDMLISMTPEDGAGLCPCQYHPTHHAYSEMAKVFAAAIRN